MNEKRPEGFSGRSVLVTGHTGFKGAWLTLWLAELGARVTGYALPPETTPSLFTAARVQEVLTRHVVGDIRDRSAVSAVVREAEPDIVLHLAARTVVREGYARPAEHFSVNVDGTTAVLDAVRALERPCAVVVVTSDKCYRNDELGRAFAEGDPLGGHDPYSASKAAQELVTQAYRLSYADVEGPDDADRHRLMRLASGRAGNVIGGGDWTADGLVADLARARARGEVTVLRSPAAIRPWQHVLEPLAGYLTLAGRLAGADGGALGPAYNFGPRPGDEATVGELVDRLLAAWGPLPDGSPAAGYRSEPGPVGLHEASTLRMAIDLAHRELGWQPRWHLGEALERTARWYRNVERDPSSARDECLTDIHAYPLQLGASR
jgi:CDP-glucose 4,6-dehydratase